MDTCGSTVEQAGFIRTLGLPRDRQPIRDALFALTARPVPPGRPIRSRESGPTVEALPTLPVPMTWSPGQ